jgi:hypothetical protein
MYRATKLNGVFYKTFSGPIAWPVRSPDLNPLNALVRDSTFEKEAGLLPRTQAACGIH